MSSPAFLKFKSLEKRSQSGGSRPGSLPVSGLFNTSNERPSPDQGLGSSVSSSTTSLQQPSNKIGGSPRASNMAALRAQFFEEKIPQNNNEKVNDQESNQMIENNSSAITQTDSIGDVDKNKVLDRRKSGDESESISNKKLDALAKGNQNDIKSMFEEHIAIKKGLIPDPNVNKGSVVKMRRKVNPNLPQPFKKFEEEEDASKKKRPRESVPIDRKMFNHFLNKFEDDQSRDAAKKQCWNLTQRQKDKNVSWSKRQEEAKLLEEKKTLEEIAAKEAAEAEKQRLGCPQLWSFKNNFLSAYTAMDIRLRTVTK